MTSRTEIRRALLFDLDGTLADSLHVMWIAYGQFLKQFGAVSSDEEFNRMNGPTLIEVVRLLKEAHNLPGTLDELMSSYRELIDRAYLTVLPTDGARAVLETMREWGYAIGVVTSNSGLRTREWLVRTGLFPAVDVLVAEEDIVRGKPDPEPYLLAIVRSGSSASHSVAIEDSPQGARAARDAGLRTFVLDPDSAGSTRAWPIGVERISNLADLIGRLQPEATFP